MDLGTDYLVLLAKVDAFGSALVVHAVCLTMLESSYRLL